MSCINFNLNICHVLHKNSPSTVAAPQIQAWLSLSRQDGWFGFCRSLVFIPFSSPPRVPVQQLGSPWQTQGPGCLAQMVFILLNAACSLNILQHSPPLFPEHLSTDHTELNTPVPNRAAPHFWDFKIQRESSNFLGCQVAPVQRCRSRNKPRFQSL